MEELFVNKSPPPLPPKNRTGTICPAANGTTVMLNQVHSSHSSATTTTSTTDGGYVVKIKINPENGEQKPLVSSVQLNAPGEATTVVTSTGCVRISVGDQLQSEDMLHRSSTDIFMKTDRQNPYFFCNSFPCVTNTVMSSGQCSPSDTLDSGTCSDLDSTPPPVPKKKSVTVTVISSQHKRASSLTSSGADSDNESNISCDSLNSSDLNGNLIISDTDTKQNETEIIKLSQAPPLCPPLPPSMVELNRDNGTFFPQGLLQDIRDRSTKLSQQPATEAEARVTVTNEAMTADEEQYPADQVVFTSVRPSAVVVSTYEERKLVEQRKDDEAPTTVEAFNGKVGGYMYESDKYYKFHLNENVLDDDDDGSIVSVKRNADDDGSFAGFRDILGCNGSSTIRSSKGTIRGVKNRVRAGIATFLQINSTTKSYKEKDAGKLVVYSTTMGVVRNTYHQCLKVKQILRTHMVKFEERDVFMSTEFQSEIRDRMHSEHILIPQVFVDGQHIGDAETVERLNETGELRRILKPYKSQDACSTCSSCGGYRLLPCPVCNGSKKSVHRNHFTAEFVALKCMNCDEVGLVRCSLC